MVHLARLAANLAGELHVERYDKSRVTDLRFLTLTELANAYRVANCLAEAQGSVDQALALFGQVEDELLKARFLLIQADVFGTHRIYYSVIDALDKAGVIYKGQGEDHLAGRTLIKKALYLGYSGDPEGAIRLIHEGIAAVDEEREPALVASAFQSLSHWLADSGRFCEARMALWEVRKRVELSAGDVTELKVRWLEGQISAGLDELEGAERDFLYVKEGFAAARLGYKEALVGVELGMVRLRLERYADAERDILEALNVFEALGISYELKRAVLLLRLAIQGKVATVAFVERFVNFLRRKEYDRSSTF
jgi:tetratricopeptide (TPR) repeat protein